MSRIAHILCLLLALLPALRLAGSHHYASPSGSPAGDGSLASPWDLQTALDQPAGFLPGDTLFLLSGTYVGNFTSSLTGAPGNPIIVTEAPGASAILADSRTSASGATLQVNGAWTWYMDFEITNTSTTRTSTGPSDFRPMGIQAQGPETKYIHLHIHDTGHGIGLWKEAVNAEVYGCIIHNCGTQNLVGSYLTHGHGIYVQNDTGTHRIHRNVIFNNFGFGIHAYPNPGHLRGLDIRENVLFHNGVLTAPSQRFCNVLVEPYAPYEASDVRLVGNLTYEELTVPHTMLYDADVVLGASAFTSGSLVADSNSFNGPGRAGLGILNWEEVQYTHNSLYHFTDAIACVKPAGAGAYNWDFNRYVTTGATPFTWGAGSPTDFAGWQAASGLDAASTHADTIGTGTAYWRWASAYHPGECLVVVQKRDGTSTMGFYPPAWADLLTDWTDYELVDLQNPKSAPFHTFTYYSGVPTLITLTLPPNGTAAPVGWPAPAATSNRFHLLLFSPKATSTSSLAPVPDASGWRAFPQPARGECWLLNPQPKAGTVKFRLLDALGREVRAWEASLAQERAEVPMEGLSGTYFVEIQYDGSISRMALQFLP